MKNVSKLMLLTGFIYIASTSVLCTYALSTYAANEKLDENPIAAEFNKLDVNSDNKLSAEELKSDSFYKGSFAGADKNKNASLSQEEYTAHKSTMQQKETKRVAGDSAITSKIKSKYLVEKNFKSFDVSVETKDKIVMLSGFVDNEATKTRAEQIAKNIKGVKEVRNGLMVKP